MSLRICKTLAAALIAQSALAFTGWCQHGVVREYAAFDPQPGATALRPCLDVPLTDTSVTKGPGGLFYLTGTPIENGNAIATRKLKIWRSPDLKNWSIVRVVDLPAPGYRSPEIHFLNESFWLTLEKAGGGTSLVKFDETDLSKSRFRQATITDDGITPSLFLDDDGTYYWVFGVGRVARMKKDPLEGLAEEPKTIPVKIAGPPGLQAQQSVVRLRGAHLKKVAGKYHLFVTGRLKRNGLGRTGLPEGVDDVLAAASDRPDSGYSDFYVVFPNAGQTTVFNGPKDELCATWSGNDQRAILRDYPAVFRVHQVLARPPQAPMGFAAREVPNRFPFNLMLRPDTAWIYEQGMGQAHLVPLDMVPGQKAQEPWIRDTYIMLGHDGNYYLTGTSGNMDGINLWRSPDLKHFTFVKQVWTPGKEPGLWYNANPRRLFWAPEIHYLKGTYWITFCLSANELGKNSFLKSTSGLPEGPYELALRENAGVDQDIDSSLFQDDDGTVYYVWQDGKIRKLNKAMDGFEGEERKLVPADGQRVGYEGATLVKIGAWYVLTAAEWNGGGNRTDGTYDMMYSCSTNLWGPYLPRRVAVPHAGHGALFKDKNGKWNASFFGNDRTAPWRAMPGYVPVEFQALEHDLIIRPLETDRVNNCSVASGPPRFNP